MTEIFAAFEALCVFKDEGEQEGDDAPTKPTRSPDDCKARFDFQRTAEDFLLFDMPETRVNKESQRLMRDFSIGEIALYFVKQAVDR